MKVKNIGNFPGEYVDELSAIAVELAKPLQLEIRELEVMTPQPVIITEEDSIPIGEILKTGENIFDANYHGRSQTLTLSIDEHTLATKPRRWKELNLEYLLSMCKDISEGLYSTSLMVPDDKTANRYSEAFESYQSYLASIRQIRVFGIDDFGEFQEDGLEGFIRWQDRKFREALKDKDSSLMMAVVFSCLKEYIKNDLCFLYPSYMKDALFQVARTAEDCFNDISKTPLDWQEKNKLLNLTVNCLQWKIDLPNTYMHDQVYAIDSTRDIQFSRRLALRLGLHNHETAAYAIGIELRFSSFLSDKIDPLK